MCFFECLPAFVRGGAAAPNRLFGEGCLSGASSRAILFGAEAEGPRGPRTGGNGFGSFCRNKRPALSLVEGTSSRGRESPHLIIAKQAHTKERGSILFTN